MYFYDTNFGNGKWIDGKAHIETYWLQRWRPALLFQQAVMRDIIETGPLQLQRRLSQLLTDSKIQIFFTWGGNQVYQQTIKNPCKDDSTGSNRQPRDVQVVDPITVGPRFVFHSWDWRRGFLSEAAIKRIREQPLDYEAYSFMPKRPRFFPPTTGGEQLPGEQEESSSSAEENNLISFEEGQEPKAQAVHKQLLKHLRKQRVLGQRLRALYQNLQKTQAGLHINPLLSIHA